MSFDYEEDLTTLGAADEVIDWFATFQTWITGIGWTVESGSGTTDLFLRSSGEAGGLTKLFVHIWREIANPNRVRMEVCDDAVGALGTHYTTNDGYIDSGGAQFKYFMNADKDAINIVWKTGAGYRWKYAGLTYPFAATVTDETYRMVSADRIQSTGAILRNHDGTWDVNGTLYDNTLLDDSIPDRYDDSFALIGVYFNTGVNIGGQLMHVSGGIEPTNAINPEDRVVSGVAPATGTWTILSDSLNIKFSLRTGGDLPTGYADGANFAHQTGTAPDIVTFLTSIIPTFLTGIGWTDQGEQGKANCDMSRLFTSTGEEGNDLIIVGWGHQHAINAGLYGWIMDDLGASHYIYQDPLNMVSGDFPTFYAITADRDCVVLTIQRGVAYDRIWMGMLQAFAPGLYASGLTPYKALLLTQQGLTSGVRLLRGHNGAWGSPGAGLMCGMSLAESASNPNAFDAATYHVWPTVITFGVGGNNEPIGVARYHFGTNGGGVSSLDTITIGGKVYTVFFDTNGLAWAMRTA